MVPRWRGRPGPAKLVPAAPAVRRLAREIGVDISDVQGSGPGGRLTIDDVKAHAHRLLSSTAASGIPTSSPDLPDLSRWGEISEEPLSKVRRLTAERMAHAWLSVPQVTHYDVADITELEELRRRYRDRVAEVGGALTLTAILAKVVAAALRVFPRFNSALDVRRALLLRRHNVHIGVAVDTEHGLLVPVIRDADTKSITRIAIELSDLAERTRSRKVMPDELQGGSFSISNLGGIGGTAFSPIVNWPEVAILGISRASIQPKWSDSEMRPRLMAPLSLSYDHRVIDGAEAARFVRWIAEALEEPLLLVLE
jgi:pyruvate dehydrogenase E2 component (dihydrolipoamide acetyltransferase)